jgi:hypothetical protein
MFSATFPRQVIFGRHDTQHKGLICDAQHSKTAIAIYIMLCWKSLCWVSKCWMLCRRFLKLNILEVSSQLASKPKTTIFICVSCSFTFFFTEKCKFGKRQLIFRICGRKIQILLISWKLQNYKFLNQRMNTWTV